MTRVSSIARASLVMSIIVLLALIVMWVRGLMIRDQIVFDAAGRTFIIQSFPHHLSLLFGPALSPGSRNLQTTFGIDQYPSQPRYWEVRYQLARGGYRRIALPYWLPVMLLSAIPIWAATSRLVHRRRQRHGLCTNCGYDLRASTDRCPECGEPIPA